MGNTAEFVRVVKDGVTINLVGGAGNSQVCRVGTEFPVAAVPEHIVQALRGGDPYTLESLELVEHEGPPTQAASSGASGSDDEGKLDPSKEHVKDVLQHLESADANEVKRVKAAERRGKKRQTILDWKPPKGAAKREPSSSSEGPPTPEYDNLDASQVIALIRTNADDEEFVAKVRAYEAEHENREEILSYDPANDIEAERRDPTAPSQPSTEGAA